MNTSKRNNGKNTMNKQQQYAELLKYCQVNKIPSYFELAKLVVKLPENLKPICLELASKGRANGDTSDDVKVIPQGIFLYCSVAQGICGGFRALRWDGVNWIKRNGEIERGRIYYWSDDLPQLTRNNFFE